MNTKCIFPASAILLLAFAISAFSHEHEESFWFGHPGKAAEVTQSIKIDAMDIKFAPSDIAIRAGQTVQFQITNSGKLEHEFLLGDAAQQAEHGKEMAAMPGMKMRHINGISVAPGKTESFIWSFTKAGRLQYGCHVPGHYTAGMVGELTVQ